MTVPRGTGTIDLVLSAATNALGDDQNMSPLPGICHPKAPKPLATVRNLQRALQGLANRVGDPSVSTDTDGLVGPHTVAAVNYAVPKYTQAPGVLATGSLTHPQIVSFAPQLTGYVNAAPVAAAQPSAPAVPAMTTTQTASQPFLTPGEASTISTAFASLLHPQGGRPMYPQAPAAYYPPAHMAPHQASVDIKAFIPAQYEHVKFNPVVVGGFIAAIVVTVMVMQRKGEK